MRFHEQGILRVGTADLTEHAALYRLYRLIAERTVSGEYIVGNISGKTGRTVDREDLLRLR